MRPISAGPLSEAVTKLLGVMVANRKLLVERGRN